MPLLKRKKGESRQQQAVRTEISDYERHPKKFPGGKKQAIAIGLSMARKGINYMSFYDIIKAKSSKFDLNDFVEKNEEVRKKRREAHDVAAEAAGRKLPSRARGLPFTKRGKKGEPFERAAGKDARPITMETRLKVLAEGRGNKGIIDRLKGAKTKPVSPLFGKSLKDSYSLDQQWKANRKRKEKAIRNAPMHASKPVSTEVKEERKKRTTDRGVAAIAAGREDSLPAQFAANPTQARGKPFQPARALGYPQVNRSGDEQLNRREANAKRLKKFGKSLYDAINLLRKSGRANKLFAKSFYDLVKGKNSKMMKQRLKERAKEQKERDIVNTAHAAGRRPPGFGSKQEALSPREFSPHYEEKAKLNNRSKNINWRKTSKDFGVDDEG